MEYSRENYLHGPLELIYFFYGLESFKIPCMTLCSNFNAIYGTTITFDPNTVKCHAKWPEYPCYRKCIASLYATVSCDVRKIYLFPLWRFPFSMFYLDIKIHSRYINVVKKQSVLLTWRKLALCADTRALMHACNKPIKGCMRLTLIIFLADEKTEYPR